MYDQGLGSFEIRDLADDVDLPPPVILKTRPFSNVRQIKRAVAKRYRISVADLEDQSRKWKVAHPRQIAMAIAYRRLRKFGYSLPLIGREFNRDHTTVLYACRKFGHVGARTRA